MHILFVHPNYPGQFGPLARRLVKEGRARCTFVTTLPPGNDGGIRRIQYQAEGGATSSTHYLSRTFEDSIWHAAGVYQTLKPLAATMRPDVIVGHTGFGSTPFLSELFPNVPVIGYFEYFYRTHDSDMDFRPDFKPTEAELLRARARNAMTLLSFEYCRGGYTPTNFQASLMPIAYVPKLRVIHDGIETNLWRRKESGPIGIPGVKIDPESRVVTYAGRGLEAMRGFDIFMKVAKIISETRPNVVFLVVGSDRVHYGGDARVAGDKTFRDFVMDQDDYDLSRFHFLGQVPPETLVDVFNISDLHIYLTVPFVLSWSLLNAMACGCTVLASDTEPVREVMRDGENGLMRGFFDIDGLASAALEVLDDPGSARQMADQAQATIADRYSLDVIVPRMLGFFEDVVAGRFPAIVSQ